MPAVRILRHSPMINRISVEEDYFETINAREGERHCQALDFQWFIQRDSRGYHRHTLKSFNTSLSTFSKDVLLADLDPLISTKISYSFMRHVRNKVK